MNLVEEVLNNNIVKQYINLNENLVSNIICLYLPYIIENNFKIIKQSNLILESDNISDIHSNVIDFIVEDLNIFLNTVSDIVLDSRLSDIDKHSCLFEGLFNKTPTPTPKPPMSERFGNAIGKGAGYAIGGIGGLGYGLGKLSAKAGFGIAKGVTRGALGFTKGFGSGLYGVGRTIAEKMAEKRKIRLEKEKL